MSKRESLFRQSRRQGSSHTQRSLCGEFADEPLALVGEKVGNENGASRHLYRSQATHLVPLYQFSKRVRLARVAAEEGGPALLEGDDLWGRTGVISRARSDHPFIIRHAYTFRGVLKHQMRPHLFCR